MPQRAAGWRIDPPVSVPRASAASPDATAAADPPLEPPGTHDTSQGLPVGKKPLFSVDEPMANSSQLVLPRRIAPASDSRSMTVALYGGMKFASILDPQVVLMPRVQITSLTAMGIPARGPSS